MLQNELGLELKTISSLLNVLLQFALLSKLVAQIHLKSKDKKAFKT